MRVIDGDAGHAKGATEIMTEGYKAPSSNSSEASDVSLKINTNNTISVEGKDPIPYKPATGPKGKAKITKADFEKISH
jgi:hypothetical protein